MRRIILMAELEATLEKGKEFTKGNKIVQN